MDLSDASLALPCASEDGLGQQDREIADRQIGLFLDSQVQNEDVMRMLEEQGGGGGQLSSSDWRGDAYVWKKDAILSTLEEQEEQKEEGEGTSITNLTSTYTINDLAVFSTLDQEKIQLYAAPSPSSPFTRFDTALYHLLGVPPIVSNICDVRTESMETHSTMMEDQDESVREGKRTMLVDDLFILIACDGLFDVYENEEVVLEIIDMLKRNKSCQEIADTLTHRAIYERGSTDNVSVVVVGLHH